MRESAATSDFFEVVQTQRAMRRLSPDPVSDDLIRKIIWAATRAPSGSNRQGWRFLVVKDADRKQAIGKIYSELFESSKAAGNLQDDPGISEEQRANNQRVVASAQHLADHLGKAPVIIVPCAFPTGPFRDGMATGSSIYPAVQNLMLAARALGLGTTLTTLHRQNQPAIRSALGIPETVETAALIPVGWPLGHFGAGLRKPVDDVTYWDTWGAKAPGAHSGVGSA
jgi:nitroreductase